MNNITTKGKNKKRGEYGEKKNETPHPNEKLKIEAAMELGLLEKAKLVGWDGLTAQETGKIGALVKKMLKHNLNYTTE